jgi:uncharacterized membrane protein
MDIGAIISWFTTNWVNIVSVITSVIGTASIIVKLTPTLKDDNILLGIIKFLGKYIALNKTVSEADRPK